MLSQGNWWRDRRLVLWMVVAYLAGAGLFAGVFGWFLDSAKQPIPTWQMSRVDQKAFRVLVSDPSRISPSARQFVVLEDGLPLGPEVDEPWKVRRQGRGAFYLRSYDWGPGKPSGTEVVFSASDSTNPMRNGRRYSLEYARRTFPAFWFVASFAGFLAALVPWTAATRPPGSRRKAASIRAFGFGRALGAFGLLIFCCYVFQAPTIKVSDAAPWLLAALSIAAAGTFSLTRFRRFGSWIWWFGGLAVWSAATVVMAPGSYASGTVLFDFLVLSMGGILVVVGCRGLFADGTNVLPSVPVWLCLGFGAAMLLRSASLDIGGWLAALVNPAVYQRTNWVLKLGEHWLLILLWIAVIACANDARIRRRWFPILGVVTITALTIGYSKTALIALPISIAVAGFSLYHPVISRRVVAGSAAATVVLAPLLFRLPWWIQSLPDASALRGAFTAFEFALRGGFWRHSCDLIAMHPWVGWGFGAASSLPERSIPLRDVLSPMSSANARLVGDTLALPGGHPHNLGLLTWLDLGMIGALLVAGLILAVARIIGSYENDRRVHAALIGLFTVTLVFFSANYDVWNPTMLSLLWIPAALAGSVLPTDRSRPLQPGFKQGIAVAAIVCVGLASLGWVRADRWFFVQHLRRGPVELTPDGKGLKIGGTIHELVSDPQIQASLDSIATDATKRHLLNGWAVDTTFPKARNAVLVFVGSELPAVAWPDRSSLEVLRDHPEAGIAAAYSGFQIEVPPPLSNDKNSTTLVVLNGRGAFVVTGPSLASLPRADPAG